jgi:type II restriction/modification system DNA methylase subunit YeeA
MDRNKIKSYAPAARRDFIKAITEKANLLGLSSKKIEPATVQGDVTIIMGRAYPREIGARRDKLIESINREGLEQIIERIAYTWFNRFLALRFMEIHSYLPHGYRVLSNRTGRTTPEILENADKLNFSGLNKNKVIELKLAGDKDAELYSLLLVAQCNELHRAMPFLFERILDETELLLPDNLLHSDSIIRKLVNEIPEDDWKEVEIIGWIYQFYISEKKDEVIGKVVRSEDIPAATQLFTPNWIVKYMVQNSLGRKWLSTYPNSKLRDKMEYYIEPAEQTPEVQEKLKSITPGSLNPEEITLMDPACGSGHILVEAYDIFKEIYLERGYPTQDIPRLILEKNLYGLDIDDRAAQLAGFALLMRARKDDKNILDEPPRLNVVAIQSSEGLVTTDVVKQLCTFDPSADKSALVEIISLFKLGKTAGSLIRVPESIARKLSGIRGVVEKALQSSDMFVQKAAESLKPLIEQAILLGNKYDCVVANPPYMGRAYHNPLLKEYLKENYKDFDNDKFSAFIIRDIELVKENGHLGHMSPFVWMFISSHESLRTRLIDFATITSLIQLEYSGFAGATVPVCTFTLKKGRVADYKGSYIRLSEFRGADNQGPKTLEAIRNPDCGWMYRVSADNFHKIPGSPIAYWASEKFLEIFEKATPLGKIAEPRVGLQTADNDRFLRLWHELNLDRIMFNCPDAQTAKESKRKWFPYNKGGQFRKWYGNNEYLVNWENDGQELKDFRPTSVIRNERYYFKPGITWSGLSSSFFGVRVQETGFLFDVVGSVLFPQEESPHLIGYLCSKLPFESLKMINPTYHFQVGDVSRLPILLDKFNCLTNSVERLVVDCICIARSDWNSFETSWDFSNFPWITDPLISSTTEQSWKNWESHLNNQIQRMKELETENNRLWIDAYGLQDELDPDVPEDQITLARPDAEKDVKRLISYSIGCMMGRYSLDSPGLIYAHSGNIGFDPSKYQTFPADDDGILPITDIHWFPDDATVRFIEFISIVWSPESLEENLRFIANSLTGRQSTDPRQAIRKYFSSSFFKDHLQTYKNRPIYWLFSSGRQRAFECLVYLHRYNEATLSRMRSEYVVPLQGKINGRIQLLEKDLTESSKGSATKIRKELENLKKKRDELASFDEKLRHYADKKIALDLDDGVKLNYGKFGDLLAEVAKVTGKKS